MVSQGRGGVSFSFALAFSCKLSICKRYSGYNSKTRTLKSFNQNPDSLARAGYATARGEECLDGIRRCLSSRDDGRPLPKISPGDKNGTTLLSHTLP